ncbi:membrane protein insertase YidC [Paenibacillus sp. OV219]|uniref:membrane protein insertase YidC n=1 Tax=Paenibacillus sp. OV219 TaxID=1884377 RepID=UPI0008B72026|nr:membrane protein insertase YidC [Paenibacillus sp. OV219]SEO81329.1 YidC/Oxa1 family membrane protein insertase [Paenibacillus sp. OV219]
MKLNVKLKSHKWMKPALIALLGVTLALTLSGCSAASASNPIEASSPGLFNHYLIYPFSLLLKWIANGLGGDYGLSIILMTLIIRTAIVPLMMNQTKKQVSMRVKMAVIQPELDALKEKYKDASPEAKRQQQADTMQLYQKHQINPLNVGCLPMLLQWPITLAFYYAIRRTPEIAAHNFLWFSLGKADMVLPFIAAAVYFVQFRVSQKMSAQLQPNANTNNQLAYIGLLSPIMMGVTAFAMPAALPLYWSVGGIFIIVQTIVLNKMYAKPVKTNPSVLVEKM